MKTKLNCKLIINSMSDKTGINTLDELIACNDRVTTITQSLTATIHQQKSFLKTVIDFSDVVFHIDSEGYYDIDDNRIDADSLKESHKKELTEEEYTLEELQVMLGALDEFRKKSKPKASVKTKSSNKRVYVSFSKEQEMDVLGKLQKAFNEGKRPTTNRHTDKADEYCITPTKPNKETEARRIASSVVNAHGIEIPNYKQWQSWSKSPELKQVHVRKLEESVKQALKSASQAEAATR